MVVSNLGVTLNWLKITPLHLLSWDRSHAKRSPADSSLNVIAAPRNQLIDCDFLISSVYNDARDANFFLQNDTTLSSIFPGFELPSSNDATVIIFQSSHVSSQ
jgi:hypothetical protein